MTQPVDNQQGLSYRQRAMIASAGVGTVGAICFGLISRFWYRVDAESAAKWVVRGGVGGAVTTGVSALLFEAKKPSTEPEFVAELDRLFRHNHEDVACHTLLRQCVREKINPSVVKPTRISLLGIAIAINEEECFKELIELGFDPKVQGRHCLDYAVRYERLWALRALVEEHKLDVDLENDAGRTALEQAARTGKIEATRLLIELGADTSRVKKFRAGDEIRALLWPDEPPEPFHMKDQLDAIEGALILEKKQECLDTLNECIEAGVQPEDHRPGNTLLLNVAIRVHSEEAFNRLIRAGFDPTAVDPHGWSALHYAAEEGQLWAIHRLTAAGLLDVTAKTPDEETPREIATKARQTEAAKALGAIENR